MSFTKVLLFFLFWNTSNLFGQNLINNGSFEYGISGYGFLTDGLGYNLLSPPYSGTTATGNYAFAYNPQSINNLTFLSSGDHTSGTGIMMIIDGNTSGTQERFWKAGNTGGGICNLTIGQTYSFSYWIRTITNSVAGNSELADINVSITNASNVSLTFGTTLAPLPNFGWHQVKYSFTPTSSCVNIELYNGNNGTAGNDFAIDDIELSQIKPLSFTHSITQPNCTEENSGQIVMYPNGGIAPYTFRVIGPQSISNTNSTGVFPSLGPGNYIIGLMDATGTVDSVNNITISTQSPITITPSDTSVCPNTSLTYSASGGEGIYSWTSSPNDLELTLLNQPTVSVSPNITTTYTATSTANNINLIYNGDFELGNTGFISSYPFQNSNPSGFDRIYGIVTNSNAWNNTFGNCIDHTFGNSNGKMMTVSGSTYNLGNDVVWSQKIAVQPNKSYQFSYWVQTLELTNPAQLDVLINGVSISTYTAVNQNCVWDQVFLTWNSGNNQTADLQIINKEYNSTGNSFSLDDLVFKTQNECSADVTVTMKTEEPEYGIEYPANVCLNENTITPILGSGFISGGIFNVVESGLNIDNISGTITPATTTSPGTYHLTYTAQVCGQYIPDTFVVNVRPLPGLLALTGGDYYCANQVFNPLTLSVEGTPNWTIYYNLDGQPQVLSNASSSPISIGNAYGTYDLDSISDAYCSNIMTGAQTISVSDAPQIPEVSGPVEYCKNAFAVALSVTNPNGVINWYLDSTLTNFIGSNVELLPSTQQTQTYYVNQTVDNCQGPAASVLVIINNCDLIIPSAFTPNSDGDNDFWNITQLDEQYPENVVKIFNRWGEPIYESLPGKYSNNPWDGKYKGAVMPVATYFYVIQRTKDDSTEPLSGTVTLILRK